MTTWSDNTFVNINSGGDYVGYGGGGWGYDSGSSGPIHEAYGFATTISLRTDAATTLDQVVSLEVPNLASSWKLICLATSPPSMENPGLTFRHSGGPYFDWYINGVQTPASTGGADPSGAGTVEMRVVSGVASVYLNGSLLATHDFSSEGLTGLYQGFGNKDGGGITTAQGGDYGGAGTVPDQVPTLVAATGSATSINLSWGAPDNGGLLITGYFIERAADVSGSPGTWSTLVSNTASISTAYTNSGLTSGNHFWYRVSAINSAGTGAASDPDDAIAQPPPPPAWSSDFSTFPTNWTVSRWRTESPTVPGDPGHVRTASDVSGNLNGQTGLYPPNDVFYDATDDLLYIGAGFQNYGDTLLRCAVPFVFGTGTKIRASLWISPNDALQGYEQIWVTDDPYTVVAEHMPNTWGPNPESGFCVRLNLGTGPGSVPAPSVHYYDSGDEYLVTGTTYAPSSLTTYALNDVEITFNHSDIVVTLGGELWFTNYGGFDLPSGFTEGWIYIGSHNHASRKYTPFRDSYNSVWESIEWDGATAPAPQLTYTVPLPSTTAHTVAGEDGTGKDTGWEMPTGTLSIASLPANVVSARLLCSTLIDVANGSNGPTFTLQYSLNGNTTRNVTMRTDQSTSAISVPINVADLVTGTNTITVTCTNVIAGFGKQIGNIGILVEEVAIPLVVNNLTSAGTVDNLVLVQTQNLVIQSMASAATVDNLALTQVHQLAIQGLASTSTLDNLALTQVHQLATNNLMSAATLDNVSFELDPNLVVNSLASVNTLDNLALTQVHQLVIGDLASAATLDVLVLTQVHQLTLGDLASATTLDNLALNTGTALVIASLDSAATLDAVPLAQTHVLTISDLTSAETLDSPTLTQVNHLVVQDLISAAALDNVDLTTPASPVLVVADLVSVTALDTVGLSQTHQLVILNLIALSTLSSIFFSTSTGVLGKMTSEWVTSATLLAELD